MRAARGFASALALLSALALAGCGGSGGGGDSPANRAPTANAGPDQTAKRNSTVTLDATASADANGDPLAYRWVQTGGTPVTLSSATSARPTFTTPNESGTLTFALTANDGKLDSSSDEVTVSVVNTAPTAVSVSEFSVGLGQMAVLDGTASTDADGDPLTYTWQQLSGPAVEIEGVAPGVSQFRVPFEPGAFVFALTVSDGEASSIAIHITINVTFEATPPLPPFASAGPDFDAARRSHVILNGFAWDPNGDLLQSYSWTQVSGPPVTLSNANSPTATFTAPETPAQLRFALRASDGSLTSEADEVIVTVRNYAPIVSNVAITPEAAYTNDALVANADLHDPDADALTATYEWTRNGTVMSSETSNTFPASLTTKNDVIAVKMTFDDGLEQTTVDASTVILDSPATLTALTPPPTALNYGDTANFTVTATDPDGDAIPGFEVAFGPAGFNVTPAGEVSWTAAGPLFDRVTDFNWGVRVTGDMSSLLAGTIEVTHDTREYPLSRTNLSIPVQHSGLHIADLDNDGDREVLIGAAQAVYVLSHSSGSYEQSWVYPFDVGTSDVYGSGVQAVTAADIDGDGHHEIYFSKGGHLVRLDGVTRREAAGRELRCRALEVADLDGNGALELACLGTTSSYAYETDGQIFVLDPETLDTIWSTPELAVGRGMAIGNVDGDAALELVASGGFVFDGATRANQWAYSLPFGETVDTGDLDGDGTEEIIGLADWSAVRAYSAALKSPLWEYVPTWEDLDTLTVADINGDGRAEAIAGNGQWGEVMGIGYNLTTHQLELLWHIDSQDHGVSSIAVGDVDNDGVTEIVWGSGASSSGRDKIVVAGFTPAISVEWLSDGVGELNGPFYGGALARIGAGTSRLMFSVARSDSGYSGTRVVALTPMSGEVESTDVIGTNWAGSAAFAVADYDNDNIDELFIGTADLYDSYFAAYDFAARSVEWQSPQNHDQSALVVKQADMNGDGHADLVGLTTGGYIEIHDVHDESLIWRSTQLGSGVALALADLDDDGEQEIVVALSNRIVIYGQGLMGMTYLERASVAHEGAADLVVEDLDGDSQPEIYVLTSPYWYDNAALNVLDAELQPVRSVPLGVRASALFVEHSAFNRKNLLLSTIQDTYPTPTNAELWAIDPVTGADVWRSPPLLGTVPRNALQYADVDGDGNDEIVFGTDYGMHHTR